MRSYTFSKKKDVSSSSLEFHLKSKTPYEIKLLSKPKYPPLEWTKKSYKKYYGCPTVKLPNPKKESSISIWQALTERQSRRVFSQKELSLKQISTILYYSSGIKDSSKENRFYPSAGSRFPLEIYIVPNKITNLEKGLYHYNVINHELEALWKGVNYFNELHDSFSQEWIREASCLILISSVFHRTQAKYGDRGYRYILFEAGHLCENIYLVCEELHLGSCEIGGFIDNKLNLALALDEKKEAVLVGMGIGTI